MWSWLTWLWNQASRVYNLVASFYSQIISAAISALSWARTAYYDAVSWAGSTILYWYNRAVDLAQTMVNSAIDLLWMIYADFVEAAQQTLATVAGWIAAAITKASTNARALVDGVIWLAWELYNRAVETARQIFAGVLGIIAATVQQAYLALIEIISGSVGIIDAKLKRAGIVDEDDEDQLRLFLSNPMQYFAAYLVSILLTALAYTIAYALGTVEATLPPPPEWSTNGSGGPFIPDDGPGPGAGPLSPPLTHLYRSGYRYGPTHRAADFGCTQDMMVYACHDGTVLVSGWSNVGYGYYVVIGNGEWWSLYAHLLPPIVVTGQRVSARQALGTCDTTGNSTGNHLHLELKHYGSFVSPYVVFGVEG